MSSSKQAPDRTPSDIDPTDRIKGFLARQRPEYVGGAITPKEQLEDRIRGLRDAGNWGLEYYGEEGDVDELQEGDGRTRGLSDVLPPGESPRGDVYQYVPRRELREYDYECETQLSEKLQRYSIADGETTEYYAADRCGWQTTRRCRGLPTVCPDCGEWVRPEADK